ncbi:MAG: flagellar FlbD family protein [bacterium]
MITLTKLNGSSVAVNAELIETVETTPDTIITLTTGKKILVKEPVATVIDNILEYRRQTLKNLIYIKGEEEKQ